MRYLLAKYKNYQEEKYYRIYVTDGLYALSKQDIVIEKRFADIMYQERHQEKEEMDGDEIALGVIQRAGLTVK